MEFKKIQLNGFKSFADKTNFLIEEGLTGIVGPIGPTIPVRPSSIKKFVLSANDLNPFNWIFLNSMH